MRKPTTTLDGMGASAIRGALAAAGVAPDAVTALYVGNMLR